MADASSAGRVGPCSDEATAGRNPVARFVGFTGRTWRFFTQYGANSRLRPELTQVWLEFQRRGAGQDADTPWREHARQLLCLAQAALDDHRGDDGWRYLKAAKRYMLPGLVQTDLTIPAKLARAEAASKCKKWRLEVVNDVLGSGQGVDGGAASRPAAAITADQVFTVMQVLHEQQDNEYYKMHLQWTRLALLAVVGAGLVVAWVRMAPSIPLVPTATADQSTPATTPAGPAEPTAAPSSRAAGLVLTPLAIESTPVPTAAPGTATAPDASTAVGALLASNREDVIGDRGWRAFWWSVVLAGLVGAAASGLTTSIVGGRGKAGRIPEELQTTTLALARLAVGPLSAIGVTTFLLSGLIRINGQPVGYMLILSVAFVAGFTERLVKRAVETVAGKDTGNSQ